MSMCWCEQYRLVDDALRAWRRIIKERHGHIFALTKKQHETVVRNLRPRQFLLFGHKHSD